MRVHTDGHDADWVRGGSAAAVLARVLVGFVYPRTHPRSANRLKSIGSIRPDGTRPG